MYDWTNHICVVAEDSSQINELKEMDKNTKDFYYPFKSKF